MNRNYRLSETQIAKLYEFAEKKFVHWHDLQIEIVDHLASSIEIEMQNDTRISFESALQKVYKSFGIFGFAKIVQEKQVQLAKRAKKLWWRELLSLFKWPRLISLLLLFAIVVTISISISSMMLNVVFLCIYLPISLALFIYIMRDIRLQKRLLLMHSGAIYFMHPFIFEFVMVSGYAQFTSLSFTILLIMGLVIKLTSYTLYRNIRSEAASMYPTVFST